MDVLMLESAREEGLLLGRLLCAAQRSETELHAGSPCHVLSLFAEHLCLF